MVKPVAWQQGLGEIGVNGGLVASGRARFAQLPPDLARAVAYRNALALFATTDKDPG